MAAQRNSYNLMSLFRSIIQFLETRFGSIGNGSSVGLGLAETLLNRIRSRRENEESVESNSFEQDLLRLRRNLNNRSNRTRRIRIERQARTENNTSNEETVENNSDSPFFFVINSPDRPGEERIDTQRGSRVIRGTITFIVPNSNTEGARPADEILENSGIPFDLITELQVIINAVDLHRPQTISKEGMEKTRIYKATKRDENSECSICMLNFQKNDKLRELPCEHSFHTKCVDKWLFEHSDRCPVCRTQIV